MLQLVDSALGLSPMQHAEERIAGLLGRTIVVNIEQLAALDSGPQEGGPAQARIVRHRPSPRLHFVPDVPELHEHRHGA